MSRIQKRKSISQELNLLENHNRFSVLHSPAAANYHSHELKRKSAIDQAYFISNLRNRIDVVKRCVATMKTATYVLIYSKVSIKTTRSFRTSKGGSLTTRPLNPTWDPKRRNRKGRKSQTHASPGGTQKTASVNSSTT